MMYCNVMIFYSNILAIGKPIKSGRKLPDIAISLDKRLREDIAAAKSYEWTDELFDKLALNDKITPSVCTPCMTHTHCR